LKYIVSVSVAFALGALVSYAFQPTQQQAVTLSSTQEKPIALDGTPSIQVQIPEDTTIAVDTDQVPPTNKEEELSGNGALPTEAQLALYDKILTNMQDPIYIQSNMLIDVMKEADRLTPMQREQLIETGEAMIARGELDIDHFKKPEMKRYQTIAEGAPLPLPEERAQVDRLLTNLQDPAYTEKLTYVGLAQEIQTLPPALKQEIADTLGNMISQGDIDAGTFLGAPYAGKTDIKFFFN